ncbi:MAG: ATP-binding protein, partial [Candidatus Wallbacteria bacterium]|nr:ATP-binding protein [Candidatus Wallbacteria bacterium]
KIKEITVLSGKGGTGKTTLTATMADTFPSAVFADCDVDAANLALVLKPEATETKDFVGGKKASINASKCTKCGFCLEVCRFDAISKDLKVIPHRCEGCGACFELCPVKAIDFSSVVSGTISTSTLPGGIPFIHADLIPGEQNSGKLVTLVRNVAMSKARESGRQTIIIDGPPGIGCPVISALSGISLCVAVTEPSLSGAHDLERIASLTGHFKIPLAVAVNRADINRKAASEIRDMCIARHFPWLGEIPFDPAVSDALRAGIPVHRFLPDTPASKALLAVTAGLKKIIDSLEG